MKQAAHALFIPAHGGSASAWCARPLPPALVEYAAADVAHLHTMRGAWGTLVSEEDMRQITSRRIERAIAGDKAAKGQHMAVRDF